MAGLGFNIAPGTSAEDLAARRQLAYALMKEGGSGEPIRSPWQGANRIAQALVGGYDAYAIDRDQKKEKQQASDLLGEALGTSGAPAVPRPVPDMPALPNAAPAPATSAQGAFAAAGRDYAPPPAAAAPAGQLPMGMRVNNPGNIKYNPALGYAGMTGPSQHTDEGDPQMTFDTAQNGMNAAARLAATKYARGQTSAASIIAGEGGWTPGNTAAAANIAKTMGVAPGEDLKLSDPARMASFLRALTTQEQGRASLNYPPAMYHAAAASLTGAPAAAAAPDAAPAAAAAAAPAAARGPLGIEPDMARLIQRLSANQYTAPMAAKLMEVAMAKPQLTTVAPGGSLVDPRNPTKALFTAPDPSKLPAGYRAAADGNLEAIPGGPATHLPAETAGRLAMMRTAQTGLETAKKFYAGEIGLGDKANLLVGRGEAGEAQRTVRIAIEAALRAMTGAAAPEPEVERYMGMFGPQLTDGVKTRMDKLSRLEEFMNQAESAVTQGRGGPAPLRVAAPSPSDPSQAQQAPSDATAAPSGPPAPAIQLLRSKPTPEMIALFDQKYGPGLAARILAAQPGHTTSDPYTGGEGYQ